MKKLYKTKFFGLRSKKMILVVFLFLVSFILVSSKVDALIKIVSTFIDMLGNDIYNVGNLNATGQINTTGSIYQNNIQVIDTLTQGAPITVTGTDNSRTIDITIPTCTGTDKLTSTDGNSFTCNADQDTDKLFITLFTTQASTITKVNATDTVAVSNLGINQVGFGSATIVNMTGYSKIWLFMRGANSGVQSGTVTVYVYDYTGSANLVSLTFSDTSVQFRSATASISLSGLHKIQIQAKSSVATDDPVFGDISVMIEK